MSTTKHSYARMSFEAFDAVSRKAGILGRPHGSRVAMGTAIYKLSKDDVHSAYYRALGDQMKKELRSGMSAGEKAGVVMTKADAGEKQAFIESVPEADLKNLAFMALAQLGIEIPESSKPKAKGNKK